jgi:poly(hydroxyalkanoate) depolymerase family esterase
MRACDIERIETLRSAGRTALPQSTFHRLSVRLGIAVALLIAAAAAVVPAAATAATGNLTSADYTGPEGNQHYELYIPSSYKAGTPMPLVVGLHGCTQTADSFRLLSRWDALAEAKGFIVVFPQQDPNANNFKCWNFFQDAHMHRSAGEPTRIAAVTTYIEQHYSVDPQRIYASGLSAGGAMASVMAATYPDLFAAIGIGSGCEYAATATCAGYKSADPVQAGQQAYKEMGPRARPMPFIAFEGDADTTVPPVNADQLVEQWLVTDDLADDGSLNNSIGRMPAKTSNGVAQGGESYTVRSYVDSHRAELAQYWVVHGMNHAWSGGDPSQQYSDAKGPDETAAMYAFFMSHTGPAGQAGTKVAPTTSKPAMPTVSKPALAKGQFVFTISAPGSVVLLLQRIIDRRRKAGLCAIGKQKRRACRTYPTMANIVRSVATAGRMVIALPTRVHGRRLPPGRYRAVVTPADTAGHAGKSQTLEFVMR